MLGINGIQIQIILIKRNTQEIKLRCKEKLKQGEVSETSDVRVGPLFDQIGPKWRPAPKCTETILKSTRFVPFGVNLEPKCTETDLKSHRFVPLGANLTKFGCQI